MSIASSPATPRRAPLWQRLWRMPAFKRGFYEVLGLMLLRHRGMQMLNCGYHEAAYPYFPLTTDSEGERLGYQLYHRLVRDRALAGADVLEIGCGRGGGARFLAGHCQPRAFVATDASRMLVLSNQRRRNPAALRFACSRAETLAFPEATFDFALSVEATHALRDKAAFLTEVARVLRPGGTLLVADFFYTRETSTHAASLFRRAIAESPLTLECEEDWTPCAVSALETDSPRRFAEIAKLPKPFRGPALSFAGTTRSPLYRQLRDGGARYLHFALRRPMT